MIDVLWSVFSYAVLSLFILAAVVVLGGWAWLTLCHLIRGTTSSLTDAAGKYRSQPILHSLGVGRQSLGAFGRTDHDRNRVLSIPSRQSCH